jgi:hypothetical protein
VAVTGPRLAPRACGHQGYISRISPCAQRLTASLDSAPGQGYAVGIIMLSCSTPHSIPGLRTLTVQWYFGAHLLVLNASQHPWTPHRYASTRPCNSACSTPHSITGLRTSRSGERLAVQVRNASRHPWTPHLLRATHEPSGACSTPHGITGLRTIPRDACPVPDGWVLNASRHHWTPHCVGANLLVYRSLCAVLRNTQRLATLTESSQAECALGDSIKALKTNTLAHTHAPRLGL